LAENRLLRQSLLKVQNELGESEQRKAELEKVAAEYDRNVSKQSAMLKEVEEKIRAADQETEDVTLEVSLELGRLNAAYKEGRSRITSLLGQGT
jgi:chromosome segregation ATPase